MAEIQPLDHYTKKEAEGIINNVRNELNEKIEKYITMGSDGNRPRPDDTRIWLEVKSVDNKV